METSAEKPPFGSISFRFGDAPVQHTWDVEPLLLFVRVIISHKNDENSFRLYR